MAEELVIRVIDEGGVPSGGRAPASGVPDPPVAPDSSGFSPRPSAPGDDSTKPKKARDFDPSRFASAASSGAFSGGAVGAASAAASGVAAALGPVGVAAVGVAAALAGTVITVRAFGSAVSTEVDRLSRVSSRVAQADAESRIARDLALIRRGNVIGSDLARAERIRSRFEVASLEVQTQILSVLLKLTVDTADFVDANAATINGILDGIVAGSAQLGPLGVLGGQAVQHLRGILRKLEDEDQGVDIDRMIDSWLENAGVVDRDPGSAAGIPLVAPSREN